KAIATSRMLLSGERQEQGDGHEHQQRVKQLRRRREANRDGLHDQDKQECPKQDQVSPADVPCGQARHASLRLSSARSRFLTNGGVPRLGAPFNLGGPSSAAYLVATLWLHTRLAHPPPPRP